MQGQGTASLVGCGAKPRSFKVFGVVNMRLGIMGGTFDPIHIGHLLTAECVLESLNLDSVIFIPANIPPHKRDKAINPPYHRLRMTLAATSNNPKFQVSNIELNRQGPSYTIDTISELKKIYIGSTFYFITGADAINDLATWHEAKSLLKSCHFVAATRAGVNLEREALENTFGELAKTNIHEVTTKRIEISSTEIRERVAAGKNISYMVPSAVAKYIAEEGLYK